MREHRATYFCIDIECSGQVPALYDMVSLAAVPVVPQDDGSLVLGDIFYVEIQPCGGGVSDEAMAIHGLTLEHLAAHGRPLTEALQALNDFTAAWTRPGTKPVFVGHNAPFDWSFVSYSYHVAKLVNPFGYKALDTKALSAGVLGIHWFDTDKGRLHGLLGLPAEDMSQKHRADYDAIYQAQILKALLERIPDRE